MKAPKRPVVTAMGRRVIYHSPPKHPEQDDPTVAPSTPVTNFDVPDVSRKRPTYQRREAFDREPEMSATEGGPGRGDDGTEGYRAGMKRRTRLANFGKRSWKEN